MKLSELGEFGLIQRLSQIVAGLKSLKGKLGEQVVLGLGDDAAVWKCQGLQLATTDTLVEGVHFTLDTATWRELGWKSLAVNLSDIAAMGGTPAYALVSLSLPADVQVEDVIELYVGMAAIADQFETVILGGNVSYAPLVTITIALTGSATGDKFLTRSRAVPGDLIAITGYSGSSAAGRKMMEHHIPFPQETATFLRKAHLQPEPRIAAGQALVRCGVQAAIDTSDGLVADLAHICEASQVGAQVKVAQVPLHPMVHNAFPQEGLLFALSGGEDYELLFTSSKEALEKVRGEIDCPLTVIGEITAESKGQVRLIDVSGIPFPIPKKGWDHFDL